MPYLRAHETIWCAVLPSFTLPRPTSPRILTPAAASSLKSSSTMPCSMTGAPAEIFTPPGRWDFAGGDHRGDAAVQVAVDPAELILAGSPVAADRMNVAVDETGCEG